MSKNIEDRVRELENAFIVVSQFMPQVKDLKAEVTKLKEYFDATFERRNKAHKDDLENHVVEIDKDIEKINEKINELIEKRTTQFAYALIGLCGLGLVAVIWANSGFKEKDHDTTELVIALAALTTEVRVMNEVVKQTNLIVLETKKRENVDLRIEK
jgi:hypothetical protein